MATKEPKVSQNKYHDIAMFYLKVQRREKKKKKKKKSWTKINETGC